MPTTVTNNRTPVVTRPPSSTGIQNLNFNAVAAGAQAYMDKAERENNAAIAADGVGLRYGELSAFGKMSRKGRLAYIKSIVEKKNPAKANDVAYIESLLARMKPTSCIGYAMESLGAGYQAAGQGARWAEIKAVVRAANVIGSVLLQELQKDGWVGVYWNADTSVYRGPMATRNDKNRAKDHEFFEGRFLGNGGAFRPGVDADGKPVAKGDYYGTYPAYAMLNFFNGNPPDAKKAILEKMKNVPYYVGIAAGGYHTFQGNGMLMRDSHVARNPDDATNIERRGFEDLQYAWDGATRSRKRDASGRQLYSEEQSGVLVVPPGTFPAQ